MAKRARKLSIEEAEQIVRGRYGGDDAALSELSEIARDVKATLIAGPDDATRATHLVAIGDAAAHPDVKQHPASAPAPSPNPLRRMKVVLSSLLASLVGKIAFVSVAIAATTGGLAAAGSLPDAAQDALARAADKVGFELPAGDGSEANDEAGVPDELPEAAEGSSAPSVLDVIRSWDDDKGCEFGHAVATAAGGRPGPCNKGQGDDDGSKNEDTPRGKPEGAGKPEGTPQGKPAGAGEGQGKPEGTPDGNPVGAGKPEGTPGGGSGNAGDGSGSADSGGKGSDGSGDAEPPSDLSVGGGSGSTGGPPDSVPSARP